MKRAFINKKFSSDSLEVIGIAAAIFIEYNRQGYTLTLRQLYYQFVSRSLIPKKWHDKATGSPNNLRAYKNLGNLINDARLAGLLDWDFMVDRTRELDTVSFWDSPEQIVEAVAQQFNIDKWATQKYRPEVWVEKEALKGIIEKACEPYDVPHLSCRGYTSQSSTWEAYKRMAGYIRGGQIPYIIHLGDHDPSGMDMSRDIEDRLRLMLSVRGDRDKLQFKRIALNMDQVNEYQPPPDYAKFTDSRAVAYSAQYGNETWELDALEPKVLDDLISAAIEEITDPSAWSDSVDEQERGKDDLEEAVVFISKLHDNEEGDEIA